jgi:crotonobetainyl-CoA:carnitine CoA-transferase CaiB-like acyl-CoA transferase
MQLRAGSMGAAHADGYSALGVGTGLLFGIYLRERGLGAQHVATSMLLTTAHAMADDVVQYPGRPALARTDSELYGLNAQYRLYPAATGWIMLAVPSPGEWTRLAGTEPFSALAGDGRFATEQLRRDNDEVLAAELGKIFAEKSAHEWEETLLPQAIPCVEVTETVAHEYMYTDEFGRASGFVTDVEHPTFGLHPRLTPFLHFSRSSTQTGRGCLLGEHTDSILAELGHGSEEITAWRDKGVIG